MRPPPALTTTRSRCRHSERVRRCPRRHTRAYEVLLSHVKVRAAPSTSAAVLGYKHRGECFAGTESDGWACSQMKDDGTIGYVLIDGTSLGLGLLLRRVDQVAWDGPARPLLQNFLAEEYRVRLRPLIDKVGETSLAAIAEDADAFNRVRA